MKLIFVMLLMSLCNYEFFKFILDMFNLYCIICFKILKLNFIIIVKLVLFYNV